MRRWWPAGEPIRPAGDFASTIHNSQVRPRGSGYTRGAESVRADARAAIVSDRGPDQVLTINVAVLLTVVVILRLRRRTESRSRSDEKMTVLIVLLLGLVLAPTPFGQEVIGIVEELASGVTRAGR